MIIERQAELLRCRCWDGLLPDDEGDPTITCPDCSGLGVVLDLGSGDALLWARAAITAVQADRMYDLADCGKALDAAISAWTAREADSGPRGRAR
jgi:hypothetical protein